jgi:hypothetical protein
VGIAALDCLPGVLGRGSRLGDGVVASAFGLLEGLHSGFCVIQISLVLE